MRKAVATAPASLPELDGQPRVRGATAAAAADDDDDDAAHLHAVFASERKAYHGEMDKFVARNRWLIWGPPPAAAYEAGVAGALLDGVDGMVVATGEEDGGGSSSSSSSLAADIITPAALVDRFRSVLEAVPAPRWGRAALDGPVSALIKAIYARPTRAAPAEGEDAASQNPELKPWGYHALRWILFAGQTGPSLLPSLEILGREEVLRRVQIAADVAARWEENK
jgi:hypothetical protein